LTQHYFKLPAEPKTTITGHRHLDGVKGVLEELSIIPNGGTGFYNIYVDDFETLAVTNTTAVTIAKGDSLTIACTATDADRPAQDLTFSLGASSPTNAVISDDGILSWKPESDQAPSTNVISVIVTDNGSPALSDTKSITVVVSNINTPPRVAKMSDVIVENNSGSTVTFDVSAQDDDLPAQTFTYSITSGPGSINAGTGTYTWTPPAGNSTNSVIVRVTDNGTPALWDEQTVTILVVPTNSAPVLSLGTARATEPVVTFETFTNGTPTETVMFKKPLNSTTTSNYVDAVATNYTTVTTAFPAGNANAGAKVLKVGWTFKTGLANYWVRLNTFNTTFLPNPAINASARLKVDVYSDKTLKVCLYP
jgi:hypothetical protein